MKTARFLVLAASLTLGGCAAAPKPVEFKPVEAAVPTVVDQGQRIERDPAAFLRQTRTRCAQLDHYEVDFYKRERLGLLVKELRDEEHMRVKFRAEPFSVKMTMLNESHEFAETVYVDGENDGKLRCRRRKPLWPGGQATVNEYPPALAVTFGKSLNPITDFGVARLMDRVVDLLERAVAEQRPPILEYLGVTEFEKEHTPAYHIRLTYPPEAKLAAPQVDLLFHTDSLLPAASYTRNAAGQLEGQYFYTHFDFNVAFDDHDFRIGEPQAQAEARAPQRPSREFMPVPAGSATVSQP